jgi:rhodanese-related sulfurtransferase
MKSAILLSLLFFAVCTGSTFAADTPIIAPAEAAKRVADGQAVLIDVREPDEWTETDVAAPAALLPLSDLNGDRKQWTEFLEKNRAKELILYCRSGHRAGRAAKLLAGEGFRTANAGGFGDWQSAGLPVRKSDQPAR